MTFRIPPQSVIDSAVRSAQARTAGMARWQSQISTGLRVQKPSDDPGLYSTIVSHHSTVKRIDVQLQNMALATASLNQSVSELLNVGELLTKAKTLAQDGVQSDETQTLAKEVDAILQQVVRIANTTNASGSLFAGTDSDQAAFTISKDPDGKITHVAYNGSARSSQVSIAADATEEVLYAGSTVFQTTQRGATVYAGNTGAAAGTGKDSSTNVGELLVSHTSTTYDAASGSGIAPGASSAALDTVIGAMGTHQITISIDPDLGQVASLNGGVNVAFDSSSTDLGISGPNGEIVYADFSSVPPAYTGTVALEGTGTLSTDGGNTTVPIDFSANQVVTGADGSVTNVDSVNITQAGTESLQYSGTVDVFQSLINLRDELGKGPQASTAAFLTAMNQHISDLERVFDHVQNNIGQQSASLANIESIELRSRDAQVELEVLVNNLQSADLPEAILQFQNEQNLLQYVYATSSAMFDTSLLDFI